MSLEAGETLKQCREKKGLSLKTVSDALHIRLPYLQALESGRAEIIPSAVQARGFLRIYAEYLELDPVLMVQAWDDPTVLGQQLRTETEPSTAANPTAAAAANTEAVLPRNPQHFSQPQAQPGPAAMTAAPAASYSAKPLPWNSQNFSQPHLQARPAADLYQPIPMPERPLQPVPNFTMPAPQPGNTVSQVPPPQGTTQEAAQTPEVKQPKEKKQRRSLFGSLFKKKKPSASVEKSTKDEAPSAREIFQDIGSKLAFRRKSLSLSLEDCESQTLIRSIYLESIENGKFDQLPSYIQARGMLNNYASFLDMDVDTIMLQFATALQQLPKDKTLQQPDKKRKAAKKAGKLQKFFTPDLFVGVFVIVGISGVVIYSALTIAAYRRNAANVPTSDLSRSIVEQLIDTTKTPSFLPTASPTATQSPLNAAVAAEQEEEAQEAAGIASNSPVHLFITANQRTWMNIIADGKEVFSGRTLPNNTYPFDAQNLIELKTGNADALSVVYNQQNLGRLGTLGEIVEIDFSPMYAATPTPQFSPTPTQTFEPTYTSLPETPLPTNTPTPYIP